MLPLNAISPPLPPALMTVGEPSDRFRLKQPVEMRPKSPAPFRDVAEDECLDFLLAVFLFLGALYCLMILSLFWKQTGFLVRLSSRAIERLAELPFRGLQQMEA